MGTHAAKAGLLCVGFVGVFASSQVETFISDVQVGDQLNTVTPQVNSPVLRSQRCHTDTGRTRKSLTERLMLQHVSLTSVALLSSTQVSSVFTPSLTYLESSFSSY